MSSVPVAAPPVPQTTTTRIGPVLVAFAIGTAVAIGLGVYGRLHDPTGQAINLAGFSSGLAAKAALTTVAMVLAVVQTVTALGLFGRIPLTGGWVAPVHRWSGRVAVAVTVPVAVHCLYALGFQTFDARVLTPLALRLLLLRGVRLQDADPDPGRLAEVGAAAARRPGAEWAHRPVDDRGAVVLPQLLTVQRCLRPWSAL